MLPYGLEPRQVRPETALKHLRRSLHTLDSPIRGCKLMLDQLAQCRLSLDGLLAAFPDARFLVLYRQSLAEQFVSWQLAKATNQWILLDGQNVSEASIPIDPSNLRSYCEKIRAAYRSVLDCSWLPERSVLLSYEELTANPIKWLSEHICPSLAVPYAPPETKLRKQSTQSLSQRVANYDEVAALLASSLCKQDYSFHSREQAVRPAA